MTSPYAKYPNLKVDGRPIDVFLPAFASPALTNALIVLWLLVVWGERTKQATLEREQRFRINLLVQVTKHALGLTTLLLVDAVIVSLMGMAALYGYAFGAAAFVMPLTMYYWRKLVGGVKVAWSMFRGKGQEHVRASKRRKESDGDRVMLLRGRALSDDSLEGNSRL